MYGSAWVPRSVAPFDGEWWTEPVESRPCPGPALLSVECHELAGVDVSAVAEEGMIGYPADQAGAEQCCQRPVLKQRRVDNDVRWWPTVVLEVVNIAEQVVEVVPEISYARKWRFYRHHVLRNFSDRW